MVRTTLTLDDDVAAKLRSEARESGRSVRDVVNETIRRGFATRREAEVAEPFRVASRDLGELRPGLSLDNVAELLDRVEGPLHR
jgi:predicted transcriptional regulator